MADTATDAMIHTVDKFITEHRQRALDINKAFKDQRVRFIAWRGTKREAVRQGAIVDSVFTGHQCSVGIAVDRLDGKPGALDDLEWMSYDRVEFI